MKSTQRERLYKRDIIEYLIWSTHAGTVTFEPVDKDYNSNVIDGRMFIVYITNSDDDVLFMVGEADKVIKFVNDMSNKGENKKIENTTTQKVEDVNNWFQFSKSTNLEEQIKYNIATSCESFINSIYDNGLLSSWVTASDEEWKKAIYNDLVEWFNNHQGSYKGDNHLRFYGKEKTLSLIDVFLSAYLDRKNAIKEAK